MGRKKIYSSLGTKKIRSFALYDFEYQQMKVVFEKLKRQRNQYYFKEDEIKKLKSDGLLDNEEEE